MTGAGTGRDFTRGGVDFFLSNNDLPAVVLSLARGFDAGFDFFWWAAVALRAGLARRRAVAFAATRRGRTDLLAVLARGLAALALLGALAFGRGAGRRPAERRAGLRAAIAFPLRLVDFP